MKDEYYGVLISVSVCESDGGIYDDLGYLFEKDRFPTYEEAKRCYDSFNLTYQQEKELWLYLQKWIKPNDGLYLTYEIVDADGNSEWTGSFLGCKAE